MVKVLKQSLLMACMGACLMTEPAHGALLTQWTFNSLVGDGATNTGVTTPATGAGTATLIGDVTASFSAGSPGDPASGGTDNSGWNTTSYPAGTSGSGTAGVQFMVSTLGSTGQVQVALDFRQSGTASRYWQLQATSDGVNFNNVSGGVGTLAGPINSPPNSSTSFDNSGLYGNLAGGGSQQYVQGITYTFAAGSPFENNANFGVRFVSVFDPSTGTAYAPANNSYLTSGTARFDVVSVSTVVPEPGLAGWVVCGALGLVGFRKRL